MKSKFKHYMRPTDEEFTALWRDATIVLDANALLNAYRYSALARRDLLRVLRSIRTRLWVPYQAALEFHRGRLSVMHDRKTAFADVRQSLTESAQDLQKRLATLYRDAAIDPAELMADITDAYQKLQRDLAAREKETIEPTSSPSDDPIWRSILELFEGRTGDPYDAATYIALCRDGEKRFASGTPPGYADKAKGGDQQYGDLVMWRQMLDHAKQSQRPMLFVTDDRKDDWWLNHHGKTIGPRPELVAEMHEAAGVAFHMYQPGPFMAYAVHEFKATVSPSTLGEVRDLPSRSELVRERQAATEPDLARVRSAMARQRHARVLRLAQRRHELGRVDAVLARHLPTDEALLWSERRDALIAEIDHIVRTTEDLERARRQLKLGVHRSEADPDEYEGLDDSFGTRSLDDDTGS